MLGIYNYTVILTYFGMLVSFTGLTFAIQGDLRTALTCLMISADHGDMMGDYHAIGKRSMIDSSCHIPFIIHYPGHKPGVRRDVCSLIDVAPTILSYAGITYDQAEYDGIDLFGEQKHDYVFSQYGCGEDGTYMVTDGEKKLIYKASSKKYYYFEQIPEVKDVYTINSPQASKMKDLLDKLVKTGYSQSTMRKLLLLAHNAAQADTVAELMDRCETEDEILAAIGGANNIYEALDKLK